MRGFGEAQALRPIISAHVRISLNSLSCTASNHLTAHPIGLLQGQGCIRDFHHPRVDAHCTHRYYTDDDGSLKMKEVEAFLDSKTQADLEAMGAVSAGK